MSDEWDGQSILQFHVVNGIPSYVTVSERSSKVYKHAMDEYQTIVKQFHKLQKNDYEIWKCSQKQGISAYDSGGLYNYSSLLSNKRVCSELRS